MQKKIIQKNNTKISTRKLVLNALMIALVFLVTYLPFLHIPSPAQGYFNIGDSIIMITAILIGRKSGFVAGAIGSSLADLAWGYYLYIPFTFIVKGLEGYVVGVITNKKSDKVSPRAIKIMSLVAGVLVMALGYFIFQITVIRYFDKTLGVAAAVAELPGNLIQGAISAILAYVFLKAIDKSRFYL